MPAVDSSYTLSATAPFAFSEAVEKVRAELKEEGFGVLCEIDVQATLRQRLGEEIEPCTILGACNPPLAHRALGAEPQIGVLLPCNVVVRVEQDATLVEAIDVAEMFRLVGKPELGPVATEVRERLVRVVEAVGAG